MSRRPARDDLRRDLAALAGTPVPELAPERVDATETRLRSVHAALDSHSQDATAPRGARRRMLIGSVAVAAGALAALLAAFVMIDRGPTDHTSLVLTAAKHAFIELPDGRRIEAEVGRIDVPNGSRLVVGSGGILTVDGITLEAGEIATVDDGAIDVDREGAPPGPTRPGDDGSAGSDGPGATGDSGPGGGGDTTTTSGAARSTKTTAEPSPTTRPANTTAAPPTSTEPGGPTVTTARDDVALLRAGVEIVDGEVVIRWARYDGADFRGYLVIATINGTTPRPGGEGVIVLAARRDRDLTRATAPHQAGMKIRVLVVGPERVVLAASRVLEPGA
jgi:hypothetical protein